MEINEQLEIEREFSDILRNKMSDKQFWDWVSKWYDTESIIEIAENWDILLKKETIAEFNHK